MGSLMKAKMTSLANYFGSNLKTNKRLVEDGDLQPLGVVEWVCGVICGKGINHRCWSSEAPPHPFPPPFPQRENRAPAADTKALGIDLKDSCLLMS